MLKKTALSLLLLFNTIVQSQISDFKTIDFTKADTRAQSLQGENLDNLPLLVSQLTKDFNTEVEKFRAIYIWVCNNIDLDAAQGQRVLKQRERLKDDSLSFLQWHEDFKKKSLNKLLNKKKAMCTGFAYLIKELCIIADIDCKIINGYGRTTRNNIETLDSANHSWNAVRLNNKWYLCDAVWASGKVFNGVFEKKYHDGYFLTDPILFAKNHFPFEKKWFLNDSISHLKFKPEPIVYAETFNKKIIPMAPNDLETKVKKNEVIKFKIQKLNEQNFKNIQLVYFSGEHQRSLKINDLIQTSGSFLFTTKIKHRGHYDVHLKIDGVVVATYVFVVNKTQKHN